MNNRYLHPQNKIIFFISKLLQHHFSTFTNDWYDEWKICPSSKWNYFFYFETITASFQHLDQWLIWWMIDISILKMKIFFFISKLHITASFKYLSSSFLVSFKIFSSLHHYSILLTILPNCAGPILPPAPLQQCRRLNFYEEVPTK